MKEKIGDSGVELLRAHFDVDLGLDWTDEQLLERDRRVRRHPDPLGDEADGRADRARHEHARDRTRGGRRGQRRRRGRDQARDHRRERAAVERGDRRGAHDGAAAGARAQHPAGVRVADRRQMGPLEVLRRRALREDARRSSASGASGSSSRRARAASGCGCSRSTRSSAPSATASWGSRRPRTARRSTRRPTSSRSTSPRPPETQNWLNAEAFAQMRDGVRILNVARGGLIDEAALKDALDSGKVGGCGARRVPLRADDREPAVRLSQRDRHARTSAPPPRRRPTARATRAPSRSSRR